MRNVPHPKVSGHDKTPPPAKISAKFFNFERNHPLDAPHLAGASPQPSQNEAGCNDAAELTGPGGNAANDDRCRVLAILREAIALRAMITGVSNLISICL